MGTSQCYGQTVHLNWIVWAITARMCNIQCLSLMNIWASSQQNLLSGSLTKRDSNQSPKLYPLSDFIWDFWKLPFPSHLEKYLIKIGKISAKIHEIGKIKVIFGLGMTPI